jgi:hypothetical protein
MQRFDDLSVTGVQLEELLAFLGDATYGLPSRIENRVLTRNTRDNNPRDLLGLALTFEVLGHFALLEFPVLEVLSSTDRNYKNDEVKGLIVHF